MGKSSIFRALGIMACFLVAACGTSSSNNNNDNGLKTEENRCRQNSGSSCDNYYNDNRDDDYRDYRDDDYYSGQDRYVGDNVYGYQAVDTSGCQVASSSGFARSSGTYVNMGRRKDKNGETRRHFDVSIGSSRDSFGQSYTGCQISNTISASANVTCSVDKDCQGLPVQGQMIDAFCDSQGYCRID